MIHLHTKFYMSKSNDSLLIVIIQYGKNRIRATAMLLFHIKQKYTLTEVVYLSNSITTQNFRIFSFGSFHVAMLVLLEAGN